MRLIIFSILSVLLIACSSENARTKFAPGDKITLKSYGGKQIVLERTEGGFIDAEHPENVLLIDIFGTFCPPCQKEAPKLFDLASNTKNFSLVALSYAEKASDEMLKEFAERYNAYYFLSNDEKNSALVEQITEDIDYATSVQLPLKVLLKDGKYQPIAGEKYLLGLDRANNLTKAINSAQNLGQN